MILDWDRDAILDYIFSASYYEDQREGLGDVCIVCIEAAVTRILRNPDIPRIIEHGCRKVRVSRFPFTLIYAIRGEVIRVISVMHQHREPGYWHDRT
jgi:toxin ParE1/3/4